MRKEWWTPLTGVAFVVVVIISFIVSGEPPGADDPVREIVEHYRDNKDAIEIGALISAIAAALLIFFAGILRQALREAEGPTGVLSLVAFAGAVIVGIGAAIDSTISFAIAEAVEDVNPLAVQSLQALWDNDFLPLALGNLVFLFAAGLSIVRHGALPRWLGWIAIVLGILAATPVGFFAFIGSALWIIAVSVILTMQARATGPAAPPAPAATV